MEVRLVDPDDDNELQGWTAVLQASDTDLWPDLIGFTWPDIRAFARHRGRSRRYDLLAARAEPSGPILGVAMMELPLRDNVRSAEVTVAVHPAQRRRGVGTALVEAMADARTIRWTRGPQLHCGRAGGPGRRPCIAFVRAEARIRSDTGGQRPVPVRPDRCRSDGGPAWGGRRGAWMPATTAS